MPDLAARWRTLTQMVRKQRPEAGNSGGRGHSPAGATAAGEGYTCKKCSESRRCLEVELTNRGHERRREER